MNQLFLKDVLNTQQLNLQQQKIQESYCQKSPLAELLYTRWIEGLRERWPAV